MPHFLQRRFPNVDLASVSASARSSTRAVYSYGVGGRRSAEFQVDLLGDSWAVVAYATCDGVAIEAASKEAKP